MYNKDMDHIELARMGGNAVKKKYGKRHFVMMGRARRKPDYMVTKAALKMREYRATRAKLNKHKADKMVPLPTVGPSGNYFVPRRDLP